MKAVVHKKYGPPEVLELQEVDKPVPKDKEILIKIKATTVSVADVRSRGFAVPQSVRLPARLSLGIFKPKKEILGMELAGEVESVGKAVKLFKPGDQVYAASLVGFGAYAEYICLREDGAVYLKPYNITYEEAAAIPIGARTALHFLRKAKIRSDQDVLIYGASGSVGTYAVQLAKYFGAIVTGVCSTKNLEMVRSLGADHVIDYTVENFSMDDKEYDVIFEAVNKSDFKDCMGCLKRDGTYINITEPIPTGPMLWAKLKSRKKVILSQNAPENSEALKLLKELVEAGRLRAVIDRTFTLEEIVDAHRYVEQGHKKGNVVVTIENNSKDPTI